MALEISAASLLPTVTKNEILKEILEGADKAGYQISHIDIREIGPSLFRIEMEVFNLLFAQRGSDWVICDNPVQRGKLSDLILLRLGIRRNLT